MNSRLCLPRRVVSATVLIALIGCPIVLVPSPVAAQSNSSEFFQGREVVSGEILVRFRGVNESQVRGMVAQDTDLVEASVIGRNGVMRLKSRARDVGELLRAYAQRPDVLYAEPNYIWQPSDLPNDAFFNQQWGLRNTGQRIQDQLGTAGADIRAVQAWEVTEGSRQIVVGVVDSGIDALHPDLAVNLWSAPAPFTVIIAGESITCAAGTHGFNAIAKTCAPHDESGHGTMVAGVIGAAGNNGIGVSGVSRVASMMDLKFMGVNGGSTADAVAAIDFAIQAKALFGPAANVRILNASWGGLGFSNVLLEAV